MPEIKTIKDCTEFTGFVKRETDQAILFEFDLPYSTVREWIPISQVDYLMRGKSIAEKDKIRIKTWIAKRKNLIEEE